MKKNFLKVAALLIAAMLLVVSCSQEVKAPEAEDNGLVEARLSVGFGRDLIVNGYTNAEALVYKYTMKQGWTNPTVGYDEPVIGNVDNKVFTDNSPIGYVTPGLWNITVDAYESDATNAKKIFTGKASVYFSSNNKSATVFLEPVNDTKNSITFDFYMQDLGKTYGEDFKVEYTISKNGSAVENQKNIAFTGADQVVEVNKTGSDNTSVYDNQKNYKKTVENLDSGYYTVTVAVYVKVENEFKLKGGITKGFLISNGANATISGHIEPSDYENVKIDAVFVNVNTKLSVTGATFDPAKKYYKVDFPSTANSSCSITVNMTDETDKSVIPEGSTVTKTLFWNSDDGENVTNEQTNNVYSKDFPFSSPGHKYITCTTIYSITGKSTGMTQATTYYYADSKTIHVYVDPTNYNNSPNN